MYPELFPDSARYCYVRTDSSYADLANFEDLEAEEKSLVSQAVDARKAEFGDARWCAHRALQELGANPATPLLRGARGEAREAVMAGLTEEFKTAVDNEPIYVTHARLRSL